MKNLKAYMIYGVLAILCVVALLGIFSEKKAPASTDNSKNNSTASSTATPDSPADDNAADDSTATPAVQDEAVLQQHVKEVMNKAMTMEETQPIIGIGRGEDYTKVTKEAIENAGGLQTIIKKGDTVLIKPNLCTFGMPGDPTITDYRTVQAIVDMAKELGASRIVIGEGTITGNAFSDMNAKYNKYAEIKDVELIDFNAFAEKDCYELKPEKSLTGRTLFIPKIFMDADVVINVAKLKTHFQPEAVISLSLKNSYGIPPGRIYGVGYKNGLHMMGLKESILDLNRIRRPEMNVIEGIVGGEGNGPLENKPVQSNIVFAGKDPVALDTVALTFMGFEVSNIPHVKLAGEEKMGITDLANIELKGAVLDEIKMNFQSDFKR